MKRFWKEAAPKEEQGGWAIALDGKPLRTPAREPFIVPTAKLAQAIADEWNSAGETFDPRAMPLTGIANAAIDRVAPDTEAFAASLASYGESDLACYRVEEPKELVERQQRSWDSLLDWARRRFDVGFETTCAIIHVAQPEPTVRRLEHAVASLDPFRLAGLSPLVTIGGSLIAALAVLEGALTAEEAWEAVTIDEQWQAEQWGVDSEAEAVLDKRRRDFLAAARFLQLLDDQ
ncbi:MAG TPA: ATP12 family protein [Sphingomicrobium sp.]|nr:ATP12 family protein [Sphingomicrobium sp.]